MTQCFTLVYTSIQIFVVGFSVALLLLLAGENIRKYQHWKQDRYIFQRFHLCLFIDKGFFTIWAFDCKITHGWSLPYLIKSPL